jgi:hypothetical protein
MVFIAENMVLVKNDMRKEFVMPLKNNRKVALTARIKNKVVMLESIH